MTSPAQWATMDLEDTGLRKGADAGNPMTKHKALPNKGNVNATGIWECQPGGFPVNDRTSTETVRHFLCSTIIARDHSS